MSSIDEISAVDRLQKEDRGCDETDERAGGGADGARFRSVVVHPDGRVGQAYTDAQWRDACFWTLMARCNHGEARKGTFRDADHLATFSDDAVADLMQRFVMAAPESRLGARLAPCPPRIANAWFMGIARRRRAEEKKRPAPLVASALAQVNYTFVEEAAGWTQMMREAMAAPDEEEATEARRQAEIRPVSDSAEGAGEPAVLEEAGNKHIDEAMMALIRNELKWTHRELHDALLVAGVAVPPIPSIRIYESALYAQYGDADAGFLPQAFNTPHQRQAEEHPSYTRPHWLETRREVVRQEKAFWQSGWRAGLTASWRPAARCPGSRPATKGAVPPTTWASAHCPRSRSWQSTQHPWERFPETHESHRSRRRAPWAESWPRSSTSTTQMPSTQIRGKKKRPSRGTRSTRAGSTMRVSRGGLPRWTPPAPSRSAGRRHAHLAGFSGQIPLARRRAFQRSCMVAFSDASFGNMQRHGSQGGYVVSVAEQACTEGAANAAVVEWARTE